MGSPDQTTIDIAGILNGAILSRSHSTIVLLNHPDSPAAPSSEERAAFGKLRAVSKEVRVWVRDMVIVSAHDWYSMHSQGGLG